jgi:hypothetical protein
MMNDLHKILEIEKGIFEKDFNRLYNKLATLGGNLHIDSNSLSLGMTNVLGEHISGNISEYKHITKFENKKFSDASITGAVACGVIGTIIFPGVGTLIGAAIGSLIGFFNRTSLEDLKDNYFSKIESSLENSFDEAADSIEKHSDLIIDQMNAEICKLIDYYFEKYNVLVAEMIRRDELEKKDLQEKTTLIKKSIAELKNRQEVVENLKSRIEAL